MQVSGGIFCFANPNILHCAVLPGYYCNSYQAGLEMERLLLLLLSVCPFPALQETPATLSEQVPYKEIELVKKNFCVCVQKHLLLPHLFWSVLLECLLWPLLMVHGVWNHKSLSVYVRIMLDKTRFRLGFAQRPMRHHYTMFWDCERESANYTNFYFTPNFSLH